MLKDIRQEALIELLNSAGELIMHYYQSGDIEVQTKADSSPVTIADKASNELIIKGLSKLYPNIPVISEESDNTTYDIRKNWDYCWMLDPLDGTKEFIKRNGEFSVNLALIHNHKPVAGFIHFPVQGTTYYAILNQGAFKRSSKVDVRFSKVDVPRLQRDRLRSKVRILISRSHAGEREYNFINQVKNAGYSVETMAHGSAMKHCLIAEGKGDVYPKFGICYEWDTAPGQIILEEAGGKVCRIDDMEPLEYNKPDFENPEFLMFGKDFPSDLLNSLSDS